MQKKIWWNKPKERKENRINRQKFELIRFAFPGTFKAALILSGKDFIHLKQYS